ncbi:hypothetical protein DL770_008018 [Monosporascus sp. CRB-9-2]|nr:hypothetical protein DL770_008018 [Monosporascus sp. CRB-9-2]
MAAAFTPEQIKYLQDHIDETRVPSIHISNGICIGAATIAVILRFFARRLGRSGLGKDDYCLFLAYVLYVCYAAAFSVMTRYGIGRHVILVTNFRAFTICSFIMVSFYVFGMACVKCSILFLYHRIFPGRRFRNTLFVFGAIVLSWALAAWFPSIMNCNPIEKNWNSSVPGRCVNYGTVTLVIGIFNVLLDFLILGTPMPLLWRLRMSTRRKVLLSGAFAAGSVACIVSIARLFYARQASMAGTTADVENGRQTIYDPSWDTVWPGVLSGLEVFTGIVACCSITYRPLVEKVIGSSAAEQEDPSSEHSRGWSKISVQRDVTVQNLHVNSTGRGENQTELQPWELRTKGLDGRWQ